MTLLEVADSVGDILYPVDQLDVLLLYGIMAEANESYLGDRELAAKVHIPDGPTLIKRGSELDPLTADELNDAVDETFLSTRNEEGELDAAREELTDTQAKVWRYFPPRKYAEFLYATNHEGEERPFDRIFYDIDRGPDVSAEQALGVTRAFVEFLEDDSVAQDLTDQMVISFTGNSFHVELLLTEEKPHEFYEEEVYTTAEEEIDTITERGVRAVREAVETTVVGGHEKEANQMTIDPSQTPSGKLNRVPMGSLHMADAETVDGVSIPLTRDELFEDDVLDRLTAYTPRTVIEELDDLRANIP
jgi:hypothetical protein